MRVGDFVFRDDLGAERRMAVEPLADEPVEERIEFAHLAILDARVELAFADVVDDGVAEYVVHGGADGDVLGALTDDDGKFDFPIHEDIVRADGNGAEGRVDAGGRLPED